MKPHRFKKSFDAKSNAFWYVYEFDQPLESEWIPVIARELRETAVEHSRELFDRGWIALPNTLRVYLHATDKERIEMRCRLGLSASKKMLIERRGELLDLVDELGYEKS